ncbi:chaperonin 10-like protein [Dactylonectria macrodidyma]|uniref:Chaperonin 10-like protein n=1 Tax=Dactylonectria macrodidyma TaxID=307937 RepID=A0A9P9DVI2_9HYPO|nr:chaperonin 10-like protein [Dactylonectria macrodidyma]
MTARKAIRIKAPGHAVLVTDAPIPDLRDGSIMAKTAAVALNPTDWKHIDFLSSPVANVGCDYSGTVVQVGAAVRNGLKVGDRVMASSTDVSNHSKHQDGAFAEYVIAKGDIQTKVPERMTFKEASTLGAGIITMGQSLYQSLGFPQPDTPAKEPIPVLVYGGSIATGTLAIQFAKMSGLQTLVRDMGADLIFDYPSPDCATNIRTATNDHLGHVFDAVSTEDTAKLCCGAIGAQGGKYTSLTPIQKLLREDVSNGNRMAFTACGEAFRLGDEQVPAKPGDFDFSARFTRLAQELLFQSKFRTHPISQRQGWLAEVLHGLEEMRSGKVSGAKLVYKVD